MQIAGPKFPEQEREAHERGMALALAEARRAEHHGDVPIGAALLRDGKLLAAAGNERELRADPTAHAELLALRAASEVNGTWRLAPLDPHHQRQHPRPSQRVQQHRRRPPAVRGRGWFPCSGPGDRS